MQTPEFVKFLNSLNDADASELIKKIEQIQSIGMPTAISKAWVKKIDRNLYEIRSRLGSNIQRALYFQVLNEKYLILCGFTKKTQKTPRHEINKAKRIRARYLKGNS